MNKENEIIKNTLNEFRQNYKLIEKIDRYKYMRTHFLGFYKETPKNNVDECYSNYVIEHNRILQLEENRIKSLTTCSVSDSQRYSEQLTALEKSKIPLLHPSGFDDHYVRVPNIGILTKECYFGGGKEDKDFAKCKDNISNLHLLYMYTIYPKACDEMIEKLEMEAFSFLTGISKDELLEACKQKNNLPEIQSKLKSVLSELFKEYETF